MKKICLLAVLALAAALLFVPVGAQAEMYIEGYVGGLFAGDLSSTQTVTAHPVGGGTDALVGRLPGHAQPAVIGGLKLGTWFVKEGFLGYNYPDWMKYLGFYIDFSFHKLDLKNQNFNTARITNNVFNGFTNNDFFSEGTVATLAFMFPVRYGFFPDSEVPFGRLQPYVAVGPAVMFSTQQPKITIRTTGQTIDAGSQGSTNIALAVDAGLRYMALKNVSIDASFKYRWANPSYSYTGAVDVAGAPVTFKYEPTYNLFSFQLGAAYHF